MIETLYLNGCSWTEGHLLHEEKHIMEYAETIGYKFYDKWLARKDNKDVGFPYRDIFDKFNFAANIAKKLNIPNIHNDAIGGGSNSRILRTTIDYIKNLSEEEKTKTLVIVGWTLADRNELFLEDKTGNADWARFNVAHRFNEFENDKFTEEFSKKVDKFWELYVVDIHSYYYSIKKFFEQSYLLANLLENHKIKYYFFNTFPIFWGYEKVHLDPNWILDFQKDIEIHNNNNSILSTDVTFQEYIQFKENCHVSDGHPNSLGHKLWADYIIQDLKDRRIV